VIRGKIWAGGEWVEIWSSVVCEVFEFSPGGGCSLQVSNLFLFEIDSAYLSPEIGCNNYQWYCYLFLLMF
jgi:hypothetical protein